MGAYIINVPDTVDTIIYVNIGDVYDGKTYIASQRVEDLTPYTEPDLEQVRKEAYEAGAKSSAVVIADDKAHEAYKLGYENGLNDAWDAARKICTNWVLPDSVLSKIFGKDKTIDDIMIENTASEAIATIRAYEQKKEEQIQVGDEVIRHYKNEFMEGDDAPSIFLSEEDGCFRCLAFNGRSIMIAEYPKNQYRKTGRHFPEIAEVLQKMKES